MMTVEMVKRLRALASEMSDKSENSARRTYDADSDAFQCTLGEWLVCVQAEREQADNNPEPEPKQKKSKKVDKE